MIRINSNSNNNNNNNNNNVLVFSWAKLFFNRNVINKDE